MAIAAAVVRKPLEILTILRCTANEKVGMGVPTTHILAPPHLEG